MYRASLLADPLKKSAIDRPASPLRSRYPATDADSPIGQKQWPAYTLGMRQCSTWKFPSKIPGSQFIGSSFPALQVFGRQVWLGGWRPRCLYLSSHTYDNSKIEGIMRRRRQGTMIPPRRGCAEQRVCHVRSGA